MARGIARGEIRLVRFDPPDKARPALVLTRDSALAYLSSVTVAPISSTVRGVPSEIFLDENDGMKGPCVVNLHSIVTLPQARLGARVAALPPGRMRDVCAAIAFSLACG